MFIVTRTGKEEALKLQKPQLKKADAHPKDLTNGVPAETTIKAKKPQKKEIIPKAGFKEDWKTHTKHGQIHVKPKEANGESIALTLCSNHMFYVTAAWGC